MRLKNAWQVNIEVAVSGGTFNQSIAVAADTKREAIKKLERFLSVKAAIPPEVDKIRIKGARGVFTVLL